MRQCPVQGRLSALSTARENGVQLSSHGEPLYTDLAITPTNLSMKTYSGTHGLPAERRNKDAVEASTAKMLSSLMLKMYCQTNPGHTPMQPIADK